METVRIGIVGAGNRGYRHAEEYRGIEGASVEAVADVDEATARGLAAEFDVPDVYGDVRTMLAESALDAVSVCLHNNLHAPAAVAAFEAGCHVFCEKPIAGTYADAAAMVEAADEADRHLGVQNGLLFDPETRAARALIDAGELGEPAFAQAAFARRRGRPYVDGYGTPAFVTKASAGGGPLLDVGTYEIGRSLYLLDQPDVERISGTTFEFTDDQYVPEHVGSAAETYRDRVAESGYDVEDAGAGTARLADGRHLSVLAAWHLYAADSRSRLVGSEGGVAFEPFEFETTVADYEATATFDLEEYERRQGRLASESGYEEDRPTQFDHWVDTVRGTVDPIPTGAIAHASMLVIEGIYLSAELGREVTAEEVAEGSESLAGEL